MPQENPTQDVQFRSPRPFSQAQQQVDRQMRQPAQQSPMFSPEQRAGAEQQARDSQADRRAAEAAERRYYELNEDEEFRRQPWDVQQVVRRELAQRFVPQKEGFYEQEPEVQQGIMDHYVNAPPAFEDEDLGKIASYFKERFEDGQMEGDWALAQFKALQTFSNNVITGPLFRNAVQPLVDAGVIRGMPEVDVDDALTGGEADKLRQYLDHVSEENEATAARLIGGTANIVNTVSDVATFGALFMGGMKAIGPLYKWPTMGGSASLGARMARWTVPKVTTSIAGSAYYTMAREASRMQKEGWNLLEDDMDWDEVGRYMGTSTKWSLGISFGLGALGMMAKHAPVRHLWEAGKHRKAARESLNHSRNTLGNDPEIRMDANALDNVSEEARHRISAKQMALDDLKDREFLKAPRLHPERFARVFGNEVGAHVLPDTSDPAVANRFRVMYEGVQDAKSGLPTYEWETITGVTNLRKRLSELGRQKFLNMHENDPKAAARWLEGNKFLMSWADRSSKIDNIYDSLRALDVDENALRRQTKDYISPADRTSIHPEELTRAKQRAAFIRNSRNVETDGNINVHRLSGTEETLKDAAQRGSITFKAGRSKGNLLAAVDREATPAQTAKVEELVRKTMANSPHMDEAAVRKITAVDSGFDALRHQDGTVEYLFPEKLKRLSAAVDTATGKVGRLKTQAASINADEAVVNTQQVARQKLQASIPSAVAGGDPEVLARAAVEMKGTSIDPGLPRGIANAFLRKHGAPQKVNVSFSKYANRIDADGNVVRVAQGKDGVDITLPRSITRQDTQQRVVREMFDGLEDMTRGAKASRKATTFGQKVEQAYQKQTARFENPMSSAKGQQAWVRSVVENQADGTIHATADGSYAVRLPGTQPARFNTLEEAYDAVLTRSMTTEHLKADLAMNGIQLTEAKGTLRAKAPQWSETVEARSPAEMMEKLNYRPQRLDSSYAPRLVEITPEQVTMEFDGFAYRTNSKMQALQTLDRFEDKAFLARQTRIASIKDQGTVVRNNIGETEIVLPNMKSRLTFEKLEDARDFVRNDLGTPIGYKRIGHNKGLEVVFDSKRGYRVHDGVDLHVAGNKQQLENLLRKYPDPQGAPDIFADIDPRLSMQLDDMLRAGIIDKSARTLPNSGSPAYYDFVDDIPGGTIDTGPWKELRSKATDWYARALSTFDSYMENHVRRAHPKLFDMYKNMEAGRRQSIRDTHETITRNLEPYAHRANGKMLDNRSMEKVTAHLEAATDKQREIAIREFGALDTDEARFAQAIRDVMGRRTPEGITTGLAHKYGITGEEFLQDYMPRIRDYLDSMPASHINNFKTADELMDKVFEGQHIANKIKPFFENMRVQDVADYARDRNAMRLAMRYIGLGNKKLYMNDAWRSMSSYMKENRANFPKEMADRINLYREQILGTHKPKGHQALADIGESAWRALGSQDPSQGRQVFEKFMSLNVLTNMAIRPWLAIRNSMQPFTTLAPRFGNVNVLRAYKDVTEGGEQYYDFLRGIGLIADAPPIINMTHDMTSLLGRATRKGLEMYKRSDDITRAVAFRTGENLIDDAMAGWRSGAITTRGQFLKRAGLSKVDPNTAQRVMNHLDNGNERGLRAAKNTLGEALSEQTMFAYRPEQMPSLHSTHILGRMFGQYGTYSAGYRANMYRGLQYGDFGERAAFVTRFVGNQMALYGAVSAAGISAYNFIPGTPALFGGGPNFQMALDALQGFTDIHGYQGAQARARLARNLSPITSQGLNAPRQLPIFRHAQWALDAAEYAREGDYWKSFLSATMTSVRRE